jgi:hypothetical protein
VLAGFVTGELGNRAMSIGDPFTPISMEPGLEWTLGVVKGGRLSTIQCSKVLEKTYNHMAWPVLRERRKSAENILIRRELGLYLRGVRTVRRTSTAHPNVLTVVDVHNIFLNLCIKGAEGVMPWAGLGLSVEVANFKTEKLT